MKEVWTRIGQERKTEATALPPDDVDGKKLADWRAGAGAAAYAFSKAAFYAELEAQTRDLRKDAQLKYDEEGNWPRVDGDLGE